MAQSPFRRNQFTLSAYVLLGFYAYMQLSLGPIMSFLRAELSLNYTVTGLHSTGLAFGMILAGSTASVVASRIGRRALFWGGGLGMCLGGCLLMVAPIAPLTILGAFMMGWLGTYLLVMIQSTLADEHPDHSAIALTESNIVAILFASFAPIVVSIGVEYDLTWRLVIVVGIVIWFITFLVSRRIVFPETSSTDHDVDSPNRLPQVFWLYWMVVFIGVALEWCMFFWSADFLHKVIQLSVEQAATVTSVFLFAMVLGRFMGSRLTYRYHPRLLLWLATGLVVLGFPMFWLGQAQVINIMGLFIAGIGIANVFPFGLSIAVGVSKQARDLASSRVSLGAGLAIFILPQVLGSTADFVGIFNAFTVVAIFLVLLILVLMIANRKAQYEL